MKKLLFTVLAVSACFALTACGKQEETKVPNVISSETTTPSSDKVPTETTPTEMETTTSETEEPSVGIPNPVVEFDTVEDAVIHVGHLCTLPDIYARYSQKASVINDTLIQITYLDDQGEILTIREKAGTEEDISGNYNTYAYTGEFESNGNIVTVKGDDADSIKLAIWNDGAYAHSIDYVNGASMEEVQAAVAEIQ